MKLKLATIAVGTALAGAAAFTVAAPAQAYGPSYCSASSCLTSNSPSTSGYFFDMPRGTAVTMVCWTDNQWWDGTNRWFKVNDIYGTGTNWLNADQVGNQTRVGHCP
jgi:hypothetical protein